MWNSDLHFLIILKEFKFNLTEEQTLQYIIWFFIALDTWELKSKCSLALVLKCRVDMPMYVKLASHEHVNS